MLSGVLLIPNGDLPRTGKRGVTFDVLYLVFLEVAEVDAVESLHIVITTLLYGSVMIIILYIVVKHGVQSLLQAVD